MYIAPPGYYLLWVVDNSNRPCEQAKFVRMAYVDCAVVTDRSTFSKEEVEALGNGGQATFHNAVYVQFDGFIHTELTDSPSFSVSWADTNQAVPEVDFTLISAGRLQEVNPGFSEIPQRITFPFHVRFRNLNTFSSFTDTRQLRATFTLGHHSCSQTLDLTHAPNPYMIDINPEENNPAWLSTDVRVFTVADGDTKLGSVMDKDQIRFIRQCLADLNHPGNNGNALFESLSTSATLTLATTSAAPPGSFPVYEPPGSFGGYEPPGSFGGYESPGATYEPPGATYEPPKPPAGLYNFSIARVRYRGITTTAQRVKCFFRMFNVAATGLEFDPETTYRRTAPGPNTVPLVGTAGGEIVSIPFFASNRVETVQGRPGATSMSSQILDPIYEIRNIAPNPSGAEVAVFFGCWLDINQTQKRIPINPGGSDGPWREAACRSIQELARGRHMCIVSEVFFVPDLTQKGETPDSSDNLSQRNLAMLYSDNPGFSDSHTAMHTFEIKPSSAQISAKDILQGSVGPLPRGVGLMVAVPVRRARFDELFFRWHNLPSDSEVTIYVSDIDTAEIQALAALRHSPLACEVVDKHTLKYKVAGLTWIPIPGKRALNIPALLSVKLPDTIAYGQVYRLSIHQVSGRDGSIIGSSEFRISVSKSELIVAEEERTLSVFKHIAATVPVDNRWYPLMQRYVHHLGVKVNALGGNAAIVHGNADGSGRPYKPHGERPGPEPGVETPDAGQGPFSGWVREIFYDCHGRFEGLRVGILRRDPTLQGLRTLP